MKAMQLVTVLVMAMMMLVPTTALARAGTLSVHGTSSVQGAPDTATIALGVVSHAATAKEAQAQNVAASSAIRRALDRLGIAAKDIQTQDYNFHPDYNFKEGNRNEITGYTVSNTLFVRTEKMELVGQIIDAVLGSGANNINSLDFSLKDATALRREALTKAAGDARDKAEVIAAALGKKIVGIKMVNESTGRVQARSNKMVMMAASRDEAAGASTPIESGTLVLDANVFVEFLIE